MSDDSVIIIDESQSQPEAVFVIDSQEDFSLLWEPAAASSAGASAARPVAVELLDADTIFSLKASISATETARWAEAAASLQLPTPSLLSVELESDAADAPALLSIGFVSDGVAMELGLRWPTPFAVAVRPTARYVWPLKEDRLRTHAPSGGRSKAENLSTDFAKIAQTVLGVRAGVNIGQNVGAGAGAGAGAGVGSVSRKSAVAAASLASIFCDLACLSPESALNELARRIDLSGFSASDTRMLGKSEITVAGDEDARSEARATLTYFISFEKESRAVAAVHKSTARSGGGGASTAQQPSDALQHIREAVLLGALYASCAVNAHCFVCGRLHASIPSRPRVCEGWCCARDEINDPVRWDLAQELGAMGASTAEFFLASTIGALKNVARRAASVVPPAFYHRELAPRAAASVAKPTAAEIAAFAHPSWATYVAQQGIAGARALFGLPQVSLSAPAPEEFNYDRLLTDLTSLQRSASFSCVEHLRSHRDVRAAMVKAYLKTQPSLSAESESVARACDEHPHPAFNPTNSATVDASRPRLAALITSRSSGDVDVDKFTRLLWWLLRSATQRGAVFSRIEAADFTTLFPHEIRCDASLAATISPMLIRTGRFKSAAGTEALMREALVDGMLSIVRVIPGSASAAARADSAVAWDIIVAADKLARRSREASYAPKPSDVGAGDQDNADDADTEPDVAIIDDGGGFSASAGALGADTDEDDAFIDCVNSSSDDEVIIDCMGSGDKEDAAAVDSKARQLASDKILAKSIETAQAARADAALAAVHAIAAAGIAAAVARGSGLYMSKKARKRARHAAANAAAVAGLLTAAPPALSTADSRRAAKAAKVARSAAAGAIISRHQAVVQRPSGPRMVTTDAVSHFYHGSALGNWHSILRDGLLVLSNTAYMTAGAVAGQGIYMARPSYFATSFQYSGAMTVTVPHAPLLAPVAAKHSSTGAPVTAAELAALAHPMWPQYVASKGVDGARAAFGLPLRAPTGEAAMPTQNRDMFGCVAVLRAEAGVSLVDGEGMGAPAGTRVAQKSTDVALAYLILVGGWTVPVVAGPDPRR